MDKNGFKIGVLGGTGQVGKEIVSVLEEGGLPCSSIQIFASTASEGEVVGGRTVEVASGGEYEGLDVLFGAAPADVCRDQFSKFSGQSPLLVDVSAGHRLDENVPLLVPGVNEEEAEEREGVVACPSALAATIAMVCDAIRGVSLVERISGTVLLGASSAGKAGVDELAAQTIGLLNQKEAPEVVFPDRLAFNLIPMVGQVSEQGMATDQEASLEREVQKVLMEPDVPVHILLTYAPVFMGFGCALELEVEEELSLASVLEALGKQPGLVVEDSPHDGNYPLLSSVPETHEASVGRVRLLGGRRVAMWVVGDNLRGTAFRSVQIARDLLVS